MAARIRYDVLLLIALLLIRILVVPVIFLDFELRQAYIAQHLCENRHRPELHCDGHCYLAKQLQATQQREHSEKSQQFGRYLFETPFVVPLPFVAVPPRANREAHLAFPGYPDAVPTAPLDAPFHPPRRA